MIDFEEHGYTIIRGFLDSASLATMSRYMEYRAKQTSETNTDPTSRYAFYADPLAETVLYNSREEIESICGRSLYPTYSYSRVYVRGDELKKHVDRSSCEISVSVNVAIDGSPWPIWCRYKGNSAVKCVLEPGDAVVYKGCEVEHWREPLQHASINAQFMLHYVDADGPYASYKWDSRPSLGMPSNKREKQCL